MALTKFERSLKATAKIRSKVSKDLHPLFDHILVLALDSHSRGYFKRSGIELAKARRLTRLK